jgi:hypothetical protein
MMEGKPDFLWEGFIEIITEAWNLKEEDFKEKGKEKIVIKMNYSILKLYIEHAIVLWGIEYSAKKRL